MISDRQTHRQRDMLITNCLCLSDCKQVSRKQALRWWPANTASADNIAVKWLEGMVMKAVT